VGIGPAPGRAPRSEGPPSDGSDDHPRDADTGGLTGALTANFHRASHTPVEEAHAFARLLEAGLTRKGITQRLQVSRELVRDRLEILELPAELHPRVDDGTIPLGAIRTIAGLAKLHPGLPACVLRRVEPDPPSRGGAA
jgi:ParB-like chromosome segregation protein Spo0J